VAQQSAGWLWRTQENLPSAELYGQWRRAAASSPWTGRDGLGLLSLGDDLHLLGGWNPTAWPLDPTVNEHWRSSDNGQTWTQLANAPWDGRHSAGWIKHKGKLHVLGGDTQKGHYQKDCWRYDAVNGWVQSTANAPWGRRCLHMAAEDGNKLWVLAGQTFDDFASDPVGMSPNYYLDAWSSVDEGASWVQETTSLAFGSMSAVIGVPFVDGKYWMVGGGHYTTEGDADTYYNTVYTSVDLKTWISAGTIPISARRYNTVVAYKGHVVSIGGFDGVNTRDVIALKPGGSWRNLGEAPFAARHAHAACVHKGEVYILGGPLSDTSVWALS